MTIQRVTLTIHQTDGKKFIVSLGARPSRGQISLEITSKHSDEEMRTIKENLPRLFESARAALLNGRSDSTVAA